MLKGGFMTDQATRFTPLEKMLALLLIAGLVGFVICVLKNGDSQKTQRPEADDSAILQAEAPDASTPTAIRAYDYSPALKLPEVTGDSEYHWDPKEKILRFSYNVWPGWLPVIAANHGARATRDSIFYRKYGFRVEMVLMSNPVAARDAFAAGEIHTLWGSVDMMVLLAADLMKDPRTAPRIVQQIDWSQGGHGIAVRSPIRHIRDLRHKTVALAEYSPSEYYLAWLLLSAGLRPADISMRYTSTAFEAEAALVTDSRVDACISWAPDIYRIPERVEDARILSCQSDSGRLIANVYAVRADFARDHPEIVEGLVAGIFEGMDHVKKNPEHGARWMADAFGMKPEEIMDMRSNTHGTNFAENIQFFLNSCNFTNFEHTWENAGYIYRQFERIHDSIQFDEVMDFTFLQKLQKKGTFTHQKDRSIAAFTPSGFKKISAGSPTLTQSVRISFYPNSVNPYEPARDENGKERMGKLYDPNVSATLDQVMWLSDQFSRAVILIEGHADSSMRGRLPAQTARKLSLSRAEAIQHALMEKFRLDPNKFRIDVKGRGWAVPADLNNPENRMLNRRVEISVIPMEN
jgi:ABC-type nitrate/sulfonate/bicarbonate transport system substrate-binding protein